MAEITSTNTEYRDQVLEPEIYAQYNVPEYWLVEPKDHRVGIFSDPAVKNSPETAYVRGTAFHAVVVPHRGMSTRDGRYCIETVSSDVAVSTTIPGLSVDLAAIFAPMFAD